MAERYQEYDFITREKKHASKSDIEDLIDVFTSPCMNYPTKLFGGICTTLNFS